MIIHASSNAGRRQGDQKLQKISHDHATAPQAPRNNPIFLNAALKALELRFSVIPARKDKSPAISSWKQFQNKLMTKYQASQIFPSAERLAIVCGKVSGNLECLDVDDQGIFQTFCELIELRRSGLLSRVLHRRTPKGFHLLYRCEAPVMGNTKLAFAKNGRIRLETRGEGGYFLTTPSPGYEIIVGQLQDCPILAKDEVAILHQTAKTFDERGTDKTQSCYILRNGSPGTLFNQSHRCGNILTAHGWRECKQTSGGIGYTRPGKEEGVSGVLLNTTGNFYVWSSNAIPLESGKSYSPFGLYTMYEHGGDFSMAANALAADGCGTLPAKKPMVHEWRYPQPLPSRDAAGDHQGYNLDDLPVPIARAAREVARFAKVPVMSPAIIGLSCIATAIGKKAAIVEREGLEHHPALFQCLIAASGERKSPAFANMTKPLEDWAEAQRERYEELHRTAKATNDTLDAALSGLTVQAKKETADLERIMQERIHLETKKIPLPLFPSLFTTDTTEERLFQKMHDRDGAYAVMSGEGRQIFDAIMGKYSGEGRTGDAIYLAGISGDTVTRDRVGGDQGPEERVIRRPCLNVCVMVQPDKYLDAAGVKALRESGALARIWPVFLPSLVGSRMENKGEADLEAHEMASYHDMIQSILNTHQVVDETGATSCHKVLLSETAKEARRAYHNTIELLMGQGQEYADVSDIASKAVTQTVKLALVLHVADDPAVLQTQQSILSIETWGKAQALGIYHLHEAIRVQRMADDGQQLEHARRLLRWILQEQKKEVTSTFISQLGPRPRLKVDQVKQLLEILADLGYLRPEERKGSRAPVYIVKPLWLSSQNSRNIQG